MNQKNKTALVVEGGAMRGIFAAGVLDQFIEMEFNPFHSVLGVSAGAVNAATYLSRQRKRNFKMFTDYSLRPEYISWKKFLAGGHLMDLDWSWDITTRELPIDLDVLFANNPDFEIGVTMNSDGRSVFIKPDAESLSHVMKASCTVPLFYRNFLKIDGQIVSDGGVSAPIPIQRAVEKGAVKIMVIRSRPNSFRMKKGMESKLGRLLFRKHPGLVKALLNRPDNYNSSIDFIQNPPQNLQILDICPPENFKTKRFTQDYATLVTDYELGREMGRIAIEKWNLL
ncbi:patatin-like phospholipase family protein [Labilibaculum sp. K2S]|uniref:patatin-like phospholipase family protein n=1 Tax=Labilibaculum sp. K2S TaxID=3056386 RepID=UPI0025A36B37|nr:patatin family protein [Labilibaculum sp. K2S]